jgi:hypothetical protein
MERKEQEPFDREAWRRLLGADSGAPTKEMDRRILADARRALAPHIGRWWLPASLAASLLLAVLIVQWQLADVRRPTAVTEADVRAAAPATAAREITAPAKMETPAPRQDAPASAITSVPPPLVELPDFESPGAPVSAAPVPPPAVEPAIPEIEERKLSRNQTAVAKSAADTATAAAPAPAQAQAGAESAPTLGMLSAKESHAELRTPEQWYADIEALRAAGRIKEADAELARLKAKYPGWLESHEKKDP